MIYLRFNFLTFSFYCIFSNRMSKNSGTPAHTARSTVACSRTRSSCCGRASSSFTRSRSARTVSFKSARTLPCLLLTFISTRTRIRAPSPRARVSPRRRPRHRPRTRPRSRWPPFRHVWVRRRQSYHHLLQLFESSCISSLKHKAKHSG